MRGTTTPAPERGMEEGEREGDGEGERERGEGGETERERERERREREREGSGLLQKRVCVHISEGELGLLSSGNSLSVCTRKIQSNIYSR